MASNDVVPKAGGSSGRGVVVPWPRHDIVDAWPLASPIWLSLTHLPCSLPQAGPDLDSPLGGGSAGDVRVLGGAVSLPGGWPAAFTTR